MKGGREKKGNKEGKGWERGRMGKGRQGAGAPTRLVCTTPLVGSHVDESSPKR